jgi:DNA-binding response OmpR family regulator
MSRNAVAVIDDDPDYREVVATVVDMLGLDAVGAEDCAQGIAVIERASPRIVAVLLDYLMPGLTPVQCVAGLRAVSGSAPIILISAAADIGSLARMLELEHWLAKPFAIDALRGLLRSLKIVK